MSTIYSAAIDTSDIIFHFAEESVWGVAPSPAVAYDALRLTGESLSESKQRSRPQEIKSDGVVSHAITNQVGVEGALNFALSAGTFNHFLSSGLNGSFSTAVNISAADIDALAPDKFTSGATNFTTSNISVGQWIKVGGFLTNTTVNNGYFRVTAIAAAQLTVESSTIVTETSTANITMVGSMVRNGTSFRSFFLEKKLASNLFLKYAGAYVSALNLNASVGSFVEGSVNLMAKSELNAASTSSNGTTTAAPTGRVIDTVVGVADIRIDGVALSTPAQSVQLNITKQNARSQYAIGSSSAQGMGRGTIDVNGTLSLYFLNFTMYQYYKDEQDVRLSFRLSDSAGAGYMITLPAASLMNPTIVAGGPDSDVMAEFQIEGNPGSVAPYAGIICQIDKF